MFVEKPLQKFSDSIACLRLINSGYTADTYTFETKSNKFIAKQIKVKSGTNVDIGLNSSDIFSRETESILRLQKYNSKDVFIPPLEFVDQSNLIYVQKYYDFKNFNMLLMSLKRNNSKIFLIEKLGEFLANYHSGNILDVHQNNYLCHIHGDLNNKNIGITKSGTVIVIDPGFRNEEIENSPYFDVSRVLMNFFPYNLLYSLLLKKSFRYNLAKTFLESYSKSTTFNTSPLEIVQYAILRNQYLRNSFASNKNLMKNIAINLIGGLIDYDLSQLKKYYVK